MTHLPKQGDIYKNPKRPPKYSPHIKYSFMIPDDKSRDGLFYFFLLPIYKSHKKKI